MQFRVEVEFGSVEVKFSVKVEFCAEWKFSVEVFRESLVLRVCEVVYRSKAPWFINL